MHVTSLLVLVVTFGYGDGYGLAGLGDESGTKSVFDVTCTTTADNVLTSVYLDGENITSTVDGVFDEWESPKTFVFKDDATLLAFSGYDLIASGSFCAGGGLHLDCKVSDNTDSIWHGISTDITILKNQVTWSAYVYDSDEGQNDPPSSVSNWYETSFDDSAWSSWSSIDNGITASTSAAFVSNHGICVAGTNLADVNGWLFRVDISKLMLP